MKKTRRQWLEKLRELMVDSKKTVAELARRPDKGERDFSKTNIYNLLAGKVEDLRLSTLMQVCENCDSSVEEFFGGRLDGSALSERENSLLRHFRAIPGHEQEALLNLLRVRTQH